MDIKQLHPRESDVGGVPIARLLPNKGKRPIGAWCFLDHAGPMRFKKEEEGIQVGEHPHTNLQTFTWMLDGRVLHKDSLGSEQVIVKNQVNLMTAGTGLSRGISHTEQTVLPENATEDNEHCLHAVQLWIALPSNQEIEPSFYCYDNLPMWQENGVGFTLTTGRYQTTSGKDYKAQTLQYSPLIGLDVHFLQDGEATLQLEAGMEYGLLTIVDELELEGERYEADRLMRLGEGVLTQATTIRVSAKKGCRFMLIGGEPLQQKVLLWWNFVADSKEEIKQSIEDWNNHHPRFGKVKTTLKRLVAPELPVGFKG